MYEHFGRLGKHQESSSKSMTQQQMNLEECLQFAGQQGTRTFETLLKAFHQ